MPGPHRAPVQSVATALHDRPACDLTVLVRPATGFSHCSSPVLSNRVSLAACKLPEGMTVADSSLSLALPGRSLACSGLHEGNQYLLSIYLVLGNAGTQLCAPSF